MAKFISSSYKILTSTDNDIIIKRIKFLISLNKIIPKKRSVFYAFLEDLINNDNIDFLKHINISIKLTISLDMHLRPYGQIIECNDSFNGGISFIAPDGMRQSLIDVFNSNTLSDNSEMNALYLYLMAAEREYFDLINAGWIESFANSTLPKLTAKTILITANLYQWRKMLKLWNSETDTRLINLSTEIIKDLNSRIPSVFVDLVPKK